MSVAEALHPSMIAAGMLMAVRMLCDTLGRGCVICEELDLSVLPLLPLQPCLVAVPCSVRQPDQ